MNPFQHEDIDDEDIEAEEFETEDDEREWDDGCMGGRDRFEDK